MASLDFSMQRLTNADLFSGSMRSYVLMVSEMKDLSHEGVRSSTPAISHKSTRLLSLSTSFALASILLIFSILLSKISVIKFGTYQDLTLSGSMTGILTPHTSNTRVDFFVSDHLLVMPLKSCSGKSSTSLSLCRKVILMAHLWRSFSCIL